MTTDHWLTKLIGLIALLALGAYGFAYMNGQAIRADVEKRIDRMENKLDCALFGIGCEHLKRLR